MPRSVTIRSTAQYNYCPVCGVETYEEERDVGRKTNIVTMCPNHGQLIRQ